MILDKINPYAPHAVVVLGIGLYWLKAPYGAILAYAGFLFAGAYYLATEIRKPGSRNKVLRTILLVLPATILVLAIQALTTGTNTSLAILVVLIMNSMIKGKLDQQTLTKNHE